MQLKNSTSRFGVIAQLLHWTIVALIITQYVLATRAENLPRGMAKLSVLAQHKSVGITVLALALVRLAWRWLNEVPAESASMPRWQKHAARASHILLYGLILLIPLSGWLMSSAKAYTVSWFGLVTLPDLVGQDEGLFNFFLKTHHALVFILFCVAILHALAALKHHFIDRDNVLRRMLPMKHRPERNE
jgi:cytochrome b561